MVYQSYGELPEPPTLIYQKVIQLLLEQWDRERDLRRVSRYGRFGPDRKRQFLGAMAYDLATNFRVSSKFGARELHGAYRRVHSSFGLPLEECDQVVREIESHTGLAIRTGLGELEFSHKSLQEYLCADHISRLPGIRTELAKIIQLPNECAIATVLSASPNGFFELLTFSLVGSSEPASRGPESQMVKFWNPYLTRLRVEGAGFTESAVLGFAILSVASLAWDTLGELTPKVSLVHGGETLAGLLKSFLAQRSVERSVREALNAFSITAATARCAECTVKPNRKNSLPRGMRDRLVVHRQLIYSFGNDDPFLQIA